MVTGEGNREVGYPQSSKDDDDYRSNGEVRQNQRIQKGLDTVVKVRNLRVTTNVNFTKDKMTNLRLLL